MRPKVTWLLKINAALFALSIAFASYLVWNHYQVESGDPRYKSFCSISEKVDCDAVNGSAYSEVMGVPVAALALGYYVFALILGIVGVRSVALRKDALLLLVLFGAIGTGVSVVMGGIQAFALHTYCLMCLSLAFLDFVTFGVSWMAAVDYRGGRSWKEFSREVELKPVSMFVALGVALVLAAHLGTAGALKRSVPYEEDEFASDFRGQPVLDVPVGDSPRMGFAGEAPPVRVVEFADFQCPACGAAAGHMARLLKEYGSRLQLVFKNFPLDSLCNAHVKVRMHPQACFAAKAGVCAGKQGRFGEFYHRAFANQSELSEINVRIWADQLGLNMASFEDCLAAPETATAIQKDIDLAASLGLSSTPTFFVNGKKVEGAIDENRLKTIFKVLGK